MEMWRWEPRDMGERRVEVNVADFSVAALEGERILFQARAIVGKPQTPTRVTVQAPKEGTFSTLTPARS